MDSGPLGGNMTNQPLYLTLPGTQTLERSGLHSKAERLALLESFSFSIWSLTCASTDAQENLFSPRPAMGWKERPQTARVGMAATRQRIPTRAPPTLHLFLNNSCCFLLLLQNSRGCRTSGISLTPSLAHPPGSNSNHGFKCHHNACDSQIYVSSIYIYYLSSEQAFLVTSFTSVLDSLTKFQNECAQMEFLIFP